MQQISSIITWFSHVYLTENKGRASFNHRPIEQVTQLLRSDAYYLTKQMT